MDSKAIKYHVQKGQLVRVPKKYDKEFGTQGAQLKFIAFIDGDEETGTSRFVTDPIAFRNTLNRPASTFLQDGGQQTVRSIGLLGWVLLTLTIACGIWAVSQSARARGSR